MDTNYNIRLISINRLLVIGLLGAVIVPLTSILLIIYVNPSKELFLSSLLFGLLILFLIIRFSIYYNSKIEISEKCLRINNKQIDWDKLSSYDYDETPIFRKLKLRDNSGKRIELVGLLKGNQSIDFKEIVDTIKNRIDNINSKSSDTNWIKQKNFYNSKFAKPVGYILIILATILTIWIFINGQMNLSGILRLLSFYILLSLILIRIFRDKK